jgi:hypothetical protein
MEKVICGFRKWSIAIDNEKGCLIVGFNHYPNEGEIYLYDLQDSDLQNLAQMFSKAALANKGKA